MAFRGRPTLHVATEKGNLKAVDMLLNASDSQGGTIDVNNCDKTSRTAIFYAIKTNR